MRNLNQMRKLRDIEQKQTLIKEGVKREIEAITNDKIREMVKQTYEHSAQNTYYRSDTYQLTGTTSTTKLSEKKKVVLNEIPLVQEEDFISLTVENFDWGVRKSPYFEAKNVGLTINADFLKNKLIIKGKNLSDILNFATFIKK